MGPAGKLKFVTGIIWETFGVQEKDNIPSTENDVLLSYMEVSCAWCPRAGVQERSDLPQSERKENLK